jgi:hypothetical protein
MLMKMFSNLFDVVTLRVLQRAVAQEPPARRCPCQSRTRRAAVNPGHCYQTGGQPAQAGRTAAKAMKGEGGQRRGKGPTVVPRTCTSTGHHHRDRRRPPRGLARASRIQLPGHQIGGPLLHRRP